MILNCESINKIIINNIGICCNQALEPNPLARPSGERSFALGTGWIQVMKLWFEVLYWELP